MPSTTLRHMLNIEPRFALMTSHHCWGALRAGKSVESTIGFAALDGLPMGKE
jgi:acetate kinase